MLMQWTSKMCPFHISKIFFGDRYTLSLSGILRLVIIPAYEITQLMPEQGGGGADMIMRMPNYSNIEIYLMLVTYKFQGTHNKTLYD